MKCKYCGKGIADDSMFCEHCGAKVEFDQKKRQRLLMVIVAAMTLGIFAGVILAVISHYEKEMREIKVSKKESAVDNSITKVTDTIVVAANLSIVANKMQVLYAGIPNPVSVSGPVAADKLSVSMPGCMTSSTGAGNFTVSVPESMVGRLVEATVSARVGESVKTGTTTFRVKRVPDPRAVLGANIRGGKRSKNEILANPTLRATMGDDFAYDLKWSITSFNVTIVAKGMEEPAIACQGSALNDKVKMAIQNASSNTEVYFTDIKATSAAGTRVLDEFSVRIK